MTSIDEELSNLKIKDFLEKNKHLVIKFSKKTSGEDLSKFEVVLGILTLEEATFKDNFLGEDSFPCYLLEGETYSKKLDEKPYLGDFKGVIKPRFKKTGDSLELINSAELHFCFSSYGTIYDSTKRIVETEKKYIGRTLSLKEQIRVGEIIKLPSRLNAIIKEEPNFCLDLFKTSSRASINPKEEGIINVYFESINQ